MTVAVGEERYLVAVMSSPSRIDATRRRPVERFVDHGAPLAFRELLTDALPAQTRYVVFDLDRTIHFGRNIGELLGWELCAYQTYGPDTLARMEEQRGTSRFLFDFAQPRVLARYLYQGARRWARPGLHYLVWGKMAARREPLRRLSYRRFGTEPVSVVQRGPQQTLISHMQEATSEELSTLSRRLLARHTPDQVIEREDIAHIRELFPGVQIILASASPVEVVQAAAEMLGMDGFTGSTPDHINSGAAKVEHLRERYPEMFAPGVVSVGFTDTGYGEDHVWAEHFHTVVDVNSDTPFPPLVTAASPLRALHSARVLTRTEKARRAAGEADYVDPRRLALPPSGSPRDVDAQGIRLELADIFAQLDALRALLETEPRRAAYQLSRLLENARRRLTLPPALAQVRFA